ncbi:MAG: nucleotidyltransferase family protein [Caldilineales bacterium]
MFAVVTTLSRSAFSVLWRGEANEQSDIDLIVEFSRRKSLLSLVALEREISEALGRKVDLLTEGALSPYLHDRIMDELQVIYEKKRPPLRASVGPKMRSPGGLT